jgi:anti-sigma B factor antagonist
VTSREANRDGVSGSFLQAKKARNSVPIGFPVGLKTSSRLLALARKNVKINIIILKKERTVMEIKKTKNGNELIFAIQGRLDTTTAPQFEAELKQNIDGAETLILDLVDLEYLSSAGLRVFLTAQKIMNKQGEMIVRNANETISEIFEVTGFSDILTIE